MIIRTSKRTTYVSIDKTCLEDPRLSFKAKGLHTYLMSRPDNWKPIIEQLATVSADGKEAVRTALKELEEAGYIVRRPLRDDQKIIAWEHVVYENPQNACSRLQSGFLNVDNQNVDNRTLINNELINNESNKVSSPNGDYTDDFLSFWEKYPRKVGKSQAFKVWKGLEDTSKIHEALNNYLDLNRDTKKQYLKHPSTFLNNYRDYLEESTLPAFSENYKKLIGRYSHIIDKEANELIDRGLSEEMLLLALAVAKNTGKRVNWPYVKAICNRWLSEDVKTFADYQQKEGLNAQRSHGT